MFRTELHMPPASLPMSYRDSFLTVGSCFSACMGAKLVDHKFQALNNPFGTVFNPLSITRLLRRALNNELVSGTELVEYNQIWSHAEFHSSFSRTDPEKAVENINLKIRQVKEFLEKANVLIVTFGTAFIYRLEKSGELVANCHKQPADWFTREILNPEQITQDFKKFARELPGRRIILTVSPVRHTKDTLPLNNLSKSILRLACHNIAGSVDQAEYFPSYEIMLDDLRDYRFYGPDLIHPTNMAEEYIWDKFTRHYFTENDLHTMRAVQKIRRGLAHRPVHTNTLAYSTFLRSLLDSMKGISGKVDFRDEIQNLETELEQRP